ncbi:DASH complex subunit Hsk3 like-domain-containing protein [Aspergillus pseudoustus]|uniref:DASH complex subunit Hsk3 like-domain-containing protein n=1 Tax=Aspergillus pseudoustus TaxID=1810923 RepID=A0ABR4JY75_9EURO
MAPSHRYSHSQSFPRHSIVPSSTASSVGPSSMSAAKTRQYAHLHSQLAQLNAHLADTENLLRMTAVQAQDIRFLGGYVGALFMGSAKVLGEEGVKGESTSERQESGDEKP